VMRMERSTRPVTGRPAYSARFSPVNSPAAKVKVKIVNGPFFGLLYSDYLLSFARCRHRFTL